VGERGGLSTVRLGLERAESEGELGSKDLNLSGGFSKRERLQAPSEACLGRTKRGRGKDDLCAPCRSRSGEKGRDGFQPIATHILRKKNPGKREGPASRGRGGGNDYITESPEKG